MTYTACTLAGFSGEFVIINVAADHFDQAIKRALASAALLFGQYHVDGMPDTSQIRLLALIEGAVPHDHLIKLIDEAEE